MDSFKKRIITLVDGYQHLLEKLCQLYTLAEIAIALEIPEPRLKTFYHNEAIPNNAEAEKLINLYILSSLHPISETDDVPP